MMSLQEAFSRECAFSIERAALAAASLCENVRRAGDAIEAALLVRHAVIASVGDEDIARHLVLDVARADAAPVQPDSLASILASAGEGSAPSSQVTAALDEIWLRIPSRSSGFLAAAEAAGLIVANAPASRDAQRVAALAGALCLARHGVVDAPYLTVWQLDAVARSAAVQVDRSQAWDEWIRAWCALLAREAASVSDALNGVGAQLTAEREDVRGRPRTGATDEAVLGWLHATLRFTIGEAAAALGLTTPTVGTSIERLSENGYAAELTGQQRDRVWVSTALLGLTLAR